MADEEVKNGAEFLLLAEKTIDNPILSNYMKIFGDTLKIIGQHHLQLVRSRTNLNLLSDPNINWWEIGL
jgi:hypothetical protein